MPEGPSRAVRYRSGTHRIRSPEETWEWIAPVLPRIGVTRIADVTALDSLGIPVYQAVRPLSRNLSVSQGKSFSPQAAKVSAVMESVELWHSEDLGHLPQARVSMREMQYANPIETRTLKWRTDTRLLDALPIAWLEARRLGEAGTAWLPRQMLELDLSLPRALVPQMFHRTSNGLASGNCPEEALIHALCELLERHALFLEHEGRIRREPIDLASLSDPSCREMVSRFHAAGMKVALYDLTWEAGLACVVADVAAPDLPNIWRGSGCHGAPEVAASRALSEAAQSRLTYISGARDDLTEFGSAGSVSARFEGFEAPSGGRLLETLPRLATGDLTRDLEGIVDRISCLGLEAFYVDLTRAELQVPVVFCYVPGLREAPYA
ncbi:MAG: YcaO-like family protein [Acidobacteria bacterium]|nr:YcaO-like family protein [Acidobacteriota bacterium]